MNTSLCLDCGLGDKDCGCNKSGVFSMNRSDLDKIIELEAKIYAPEGKYEFFRSCDFIEGGQFISKLLLPEIEKFKAENQRFREALESISSKNKPRHDTEEYWNEIAHKHCATVLATDTKIARQALSPQKKEVMCEKSSS